MSWDVMFCHAGRRDPLRYVMECHDRHAAGAYPVACSVIGPCLSSSVACSFLPLSRLRGRPGGGPLGVTGVFRVSPAAAPNAGPRPTLSRGERAFRPPLPLSPRKRAGAFPGPVFAFLHVVPPSRFVPLRSIRPAAGLPGGGTLIRAYPARACAGAGGRIAPARLVRLIARARRRAHLSCPFPSCFFAPAPTRNRKRSGPARMPPPSSLSL